MSARPRLAILGGGLSGLSAAVVLAEEEGFEISLLEKRSLLGGRASSFVDPSSGELVDNCQHVSMRCCTNLQNFLRRIGAEREIHFSKNIEFLDRKGRISRMRAGFLPAPLHLFPSLIGLKALRWGEKLSLARACWKILRQKRESKDLEAMTFLQWLQREGQSDATIRNFWQPLIVSALNEELDRASAQSSIQVVYEALLKNRGAYQIGLPRNTLSAIYSDHGEKALRDKGVKLFLKKTAASLELREEGSRWKIAGVRFSDGEMHAADFVLCALPFHHLLDLLPSALLQKEAYFSMLRGLSTSPILGIHLWLDRPVMDREFVALLDRQMQWVFNKGEGKYLSLVVSAARSLEGLSKEKIVEIALSELREIFPKSKEAKLLKSLVIREKNATFSPAPGAEKLRPHAKTPVQGLFLAGDWVQTGWPATMEGAVRGGYLAAEALLLERGAGKELICPPLAAGKLAAWLNVD